MLPMFSAAKMDPKITKSINKKNCFRMRFQHTFGWYLGFVLLFFNVFYDQVDKRDFVKIVVSPWRNTSFSENQHGKQ